MKTIGDLLAEQPVFAGLSTETLELIAGCGQNMRFAADERILVENEPADRFYLLRSGKVAVELNTPRRGSQTIETVGAGDLLGVSWLLPPYRWTFDARAVEPTRAIAIDAACLRRKCDADPALGYELFQRFAGLVRDRLHATRLQLLDLYGDATS